MSTHTKTPERPRRSATPKQDPAIKGSPYSAHFLRARIDRDEYLVESASGNDPYITAIHHEIPDLDTCTCQAPRACWHRHAARLRQQIERVTANAENLYRDWPLEQLRAEDARLRGLLIEADSWLTRAQYGVLAELTLNRLTEAEAA